MTERKIKVTLSEVLSLASCADDYGHANDVVLSALAQWLDCECSDEEIDAYVAWLVTPEAAKQGYSEEDQAGARAKLVAWRDRYCVGPAS